MKNKKLLFFFSFVLIFVIVLTGWWFINFYFAKDFQLDASSDTLLLENDPDLKYLREVNTKFGSKDFLVLTYTPKDNLLTERQVIISAMRASTKAVQEY